MSGARVARGVLNVTGGCKYPSGYWLAPADGGDIPGDCPAAFRESAGADWLAWVEGERERWYASLDSGMPPEWNDRGAASKLAGMAGGAWAGPAHRVQGLVSEELAQYWTEHAPRMNRQQYIAYAWAESLRERAESEWHGIDRLAAELDAGDVPAGIASGTYAGIVWERTPDGWRAATVAVDGADVPVRAAGSGGGIEAAIAVLVESGCFTERMLELIHETYTVGAVGRKGRVIAAAGDWAVAVARGAGPSPVKSKRGQAILAAEAALTVEPVALDGYVTVWVGTDCEPF